MNPSESSMMAARRGPRGHLVVLAMCLGCVLDIPLEPCLLRPAADCDVRDPACVEHVHAVVACMRGVEHELPDIEQISPDEYAARYPAEPQASDDVDTNLRNRGFALLRLLPPKLVPASQTVTPPVIRYEPESHSLVTVLGEREPEAELSGLLYALILADRDAEVGIPGLFANLDTLDSEHALSTLLAGEASLFTDIALARNPNLEEAMARYNDASKMEMTRTLFPRSDIAWPIAMAYFQWYFGARRLRELYLTGGMAAIDAAYAEELGSTAHALGGAIDVDANFSAIVDDPPKFAGYELLTQDSLGPLMLHLHNLRTHDVPEDLTVVERELARGWVGDRLTIYGNRETGAVIVVWQIAGPGGSVAYSITADSDPADTAEIP